MIHTHTMEKIPGGGAPLKNFFFITSSKRWNTPFEEKKHFNNYPNNSTTNLSYLIY